MPLSLSLSLRHVTSGCWICEQIRIIIVITVNSLQLWRIALSSGQSIVVSFVVMGFIWVLSSGIPFTGKIIGNNKAVKRDNSLHEPPYNSLCRIRPRSQSGHGGHYIDRVQHNLEDIAV